MYQNLCDSGHVFCIVKKEACVVRIMVLILFDFYFMNYSWYKNKKRLARKYKKKRDLGYSSEGSSCVRVGKDVVVKIHGQIKN